jgi:LmbE family N-acetylglucosaminyl deacetylase
VLEITLASSGRRINVLCIGAHCDDIEIGCGGAILELQTRYPDCLIHWFVLTSDERRRDEAVRSARSFVRPECRGETIVCDFPDGRLPGHFIEVKAEFEKVRSRVAPDLILTHHAGDLHQDHKLVSDVTWQAFRDHSIWEYEIVKYDGDLTTPNLYVPIRAAVAARKLALIMRLFPSQAGKSWFREENLYAIMRLRGVEARSASGLAEAFHCRKLRCSFAKPQWATTSAKTQPFEVASGAKRRRRRTAV